MLLRQIFISLVDTFIDWHLRVLAFAENTRAWLEHHADRERAEAALKDRRTFRSLGSVLEQALPDLAGKQEFYSLVWSELHIRQLITTGEPHSSVGEVGTKYTTSLGDQLLAFIRAPSDGD